MYSTGPGGEDLEGGYYDAGDNLKVICDNHCSFNSIGLGLFDVDGTFQKYITIMYHVSCIMLETILRSFCDRHC